MPETLPRVRSALLLLGLAVCVWSRPAPAAPQTYTGEAPVASQSDAERAQALQTALAQVVMQITGDSALLARADVAKAVADAGKYVLQYQYRQDVVTDNGTPQVKLTLVARFDSNAVNDMLRRLGLGPAASGTTAVGWNPTESRVWIGGIESAEDYARLMGYLAGQQLVRGAEPIEARNDGVLVKLSLAADLQRFLDAITAGGTLRVVNAQPPVDGVDATLALAP